MKQKLESYMADELNSAEDFSEVRLSKKIQYKIKNICVFMVKQKSACLVCFCLCVQNSDQQICTMLCILTKKNSW